MTPDDNSAAKVATMAATLSAIILDCDNRIRNSSRAVLDLDAIMTETRERIAQSRLLLARPLPVGALPLLPD